MTWAIVRLGDVVEIERESVDSADIATGENYVGLENISSAGSINPQKITAGDLASSKFRFTARHVLYGKLRPYLRKIARPDFSGICSTDILPLLPKANLDRSFLFHYLRLERTVALATARSTGVNLPRLSPTALLEFTIQLPPMDEQLRITKILDKSEELGFCRTRTIALSNELEQAIFRDMFVTPNGKHGRRRKPLHELGRIVTGGTPPSSKQGMFDGPIPFITPGDLESDVPVSRSVTEAGAQESSVVRAGATLVCCIGATIGKTDQAVVRSAFNQQINAVEWGAEINDSFGLAVMRFFRPTVIAWGASTTLPILKKSAFERIEIPVPPLGLQIEFARRIDRLKICRHRLKVSQTQLDSLFKSLQDLVFRGES